MKTPTITAIDTRTSCFRKSTVGHHCNLFYSSVQRYNQYEILFVSVVVGVVLGIYRIRVYASSVVVCRNTTNDLQ